MTQQPTTNTTRYESTIRARPLSVGRSSDCSRVAWCVGLVPGMDVTPGQRLGIMKFGSRMDVFLPTGCDVHVAVGETVRGGETIIARLRPMHGSATGTDDSR